VTTEVLNCDAVECCGRIQHRRPRLESSPS